MAGYDIRTMTGQQVLTGMVNAANPNVTFYPEQVTFSDVTAAPIPTRLGRTTVIMAVVGYRGTQKLTYGRVAMTAGFPDARQVELHITDTQVELIAKLNEQYNLNLGLDDYVIEPGALNIHGTGQRYYTLRAAKGSLVWYGEVVLDLLFGIPRLMEDGSLRLTEDGSVRMLED